MQLVHIIMSQTFVEVKPNAYLLLFAQVAEIVILFSLFSLQSSDKFHYLLKSTLLLLFFFHIQQRRSRSLSFDIEILRLNMCSLFSRFERIH